MKVFKKIISYVLVGVFCITITLGISIRNSGDLIKLRDLWIETAMGTIHHQWLATMFFPQSVIDEIMNNRAETVEIDEVVQTNPKPVQKSNIFEEYRGKVNGDADFAGNLIYDVNDDQEIAVSQIKTSDYAGKVAIIEDASRVFVAHTTNKGSIGNNILTFLSNNNAILGVNASGFADYKGCGDGGEIVGASCASGEIWGTYSESYNTIGITTDNKLVVGQFGYWKEHNIRDGMQFNPALIINGEKQVSGSAGWGLSPRTAIGQREDGAIIIITIDGRKPGYSIGATMEQVADELLKYEVVTAAACDGGSSTIMGYNGEIITRCSSPQSGGRYLPNALLVKKI